jgi:sulfofructose kinase
MTESTSRFSAKGQFSVKLKQMGCFRMNANRRRQSMEIDVLCVGHASYDLVYSVDHHPEADEKCLASGLLMCGGGPAANAAVTVARLGGIAAFAGYLGRDVFGDMHFEELLSEGVITSMVVRGGHPTPLSSIIVKPGGRRTVIAHKGSTPVLEPDQVDFTRARPGAILFDGHEPAISVPLAQKARTQNIPTILDAGSVHKGTTELAPLCGYLAASEKFARDLSGEKDPARALSFLAQIAPVAIVTLGEAGLVWAYGAAGPATGKVASTQTGGGRKDGGNQAPPHRRLGAFPVDAVDTTGAGDIFHGAFALRIARGEEVPDALRYASAAAALGCTGLGARPAIPAKAEVEEFLKRF